MLKPLMAFSMLALAVAGAGAQAITGTLVGIVTDASGSALPGVSVVAAEKETNRIRSATTSDSGVYTISNLSAGIYNLEFRQAGFRTAQHTNVRVQVNETLRVNLSMEVGALSQSVDVRSLPLQADSSAVGAVIDERTIQSLPLNGRRLEDLALLLPGAVTAAPNSHLSSRGGFNMGGLDEHYASFFIDGIDNVDPVLRNFSYRPSIELVQEFKVEQSGYKAEFGRNAGAVVNAVTRSGTNTFHVSGWEFLRNDNLDARNFFSPPDAAKPSLIRNQFGLTLGGPLRSDKTFFFTSYEGLREKHGAVRRATVPTELMRSGDLSEMGGPIVPESQIHPIAREILRAYPLPNRLGISGNRIEVANRIENGDDLSARVDHQWSEATNLAARYSTSITRIRDPFRTETGGVSNLSGFGQTADRFRTNVGISVTTVRSRDFVNELRLGFNRFRQPVIPSNRGTPLLDPLMGTLKASPYFNFLIADPVGSAAEFKRAVNVYNYIDNVSYTRGNHLFKFGADARRYLFNAYNISPNRFTFTGARSGNPLKDFLLGQPSQVITFVGSPAGNTRKFEFATFVQDDWKVGRKLTINFGLRWEFYGRIKELRNKQSFWSPDCNCMRIAGVDASKGLLDNDYNNFAPRFGFAWRPMGERMIVHGSTGIFYDNDQRHNLELVLNPPNFSTREYIFPFSSPTLSDPFPSGALSTLFPVTYEKKFRDTYAEHWNLGIRLEPARSLLADIAYVGNRSVKARRLRNANQPIASSVPYPGFATVSFFEQAGSSSYHSLQVRVERRFSEGLAFNAAYTWGRAIDDRPGQGGAFPQDSYQLRSERASADFDVRHRVVFSGSYDLPFGREKSWGGWSIHTISTFQSGRPFTVWVVPMLSLRPNAVSGMNWKPDNQGPDRWINPAAFTAPAAGSFGNLGRNTLVGPGFSNLDVSLTKNFQIGEVSKLQLRAEVFNVFNHPNLGLPNNVVGPTLGLITATSSPERQVQFGVKWGF